MDRCPRPPAPRHPSRVLTALFAVGLALACAGCGTTNVQITGSGVARPVPLPGTAYQGGSVELRYPGASTAAALVTIGILGAATQAPVRGVPPMDGGRRVQERDCTQPLEEDSANLRCR